MPRALVLDDLIALNDELFALSRSGVPLERGLLGFGRDLRGRLGRVADDVARQMEAGRSLEQALGGVNGEIPATYRAVVSAGVRSGRLPAALEGLADYARGYADLRRVVGQAMLYPVIVACVAYLLFLATLMLIVPRFEGAFQALGVPADHGGMQVLRFLGATLPIWGPIPPALLILAVFGWSWAGRARMLDAARTPFWAPWMKRTMADWRLSNFTGLLAMLTRQGATMPEALRLAGASTCDADLAAWADRAAEEQEHGAPLEHIVSRSPELPPMLGWLLIAGAREGTLPAVLTHASDLYRRRATDRADRIRTVVPTLVLAIVGGSAALGYAFAMFYPWTQALHSLARSGP